MVHVLTIGIIAAATGAVRGAALGALALFVLLGECAAFGAAAAGAGAVHVVDGGGKEITSYELRITN